MKSRRIPLIDLLKSAYPGRPEKELFARVLRGDIIVNGERVTKPGVPVAADARISSRSLPAFVSRGGEKLAHAIDSWGVACAGSVWIDAGCSTGGFTDCLLQRGASLVYAVDVGVNQLDFRLRGDARVRPMEGTNVMDLRADGFDPAPQRIAADLSFRSLRRAASHLLGIASEGWGIFLIKPQFEWKSPPPDFTGVVKEPGAVVGIVSGLVEELAAEGVGVQKALLSPIRGRKGNRELLFLLRSGPARLGRGELERLILGR